MSLKDGTVITVTKASTCIIKFTSDVVIARQLAKSMSLPLGFSLVDRTKIITAVSELARNTLIYGKGGEMIFEEVSDGVKKGVRITFIDQGPGIENIEKALTDGFTTGSGLGMGLSGSRRLMNEFEIQSELHQGTTVMVIKWK